MKRNNYSYQPTVTVGIAAYSSEKNILSLIKSILYQKENDYIIEKIIIHSDESPDKTRSIIKSIKNEKIVLIETTPRRGFANAIKIIFENNKSDFAVILNDDIIIKDKYFISKTISDFKFIKDLGMICSNPLPLSSENFIQRAVVSGINAYDKIKSQVKNGDSVLSCDGKTMTFSKQFIKSFKFPKKYSEMGNVDGYLYFSCIKNGFSYRFKKNAVVYFKCPSTIPDLVNWTIRNNITRGVFEKKFGQELLNEYKPPFLKFSMYKFIEFLKNPIGCMFILLLNLYCSVIPSFRNTQFSPTWNLVRSTKNI